MTEREMLRAALKAAMGHLVRLRYGRMTPQEEAANYDRVLAMATDAYRWTQREKSR